VLCRNVNVTTEPTAIFSFYHKNLHKKIGKKIAGTKFITLNFEIPSIFMASPLCNDPTIAMAPTQNKRLEFSFPQTSAPEKSPAY